MSSVRARDGELGSRDRFRLAWSTVDGVLLIIAILSSCVLMATILVIWNPYTVTSSFQFSQCVLISRTVQTDNPRTCLSKTADSCVIASSPAAAAAAATAQTSNTPVADDETLPFQSVTDGVAGSKTLAVRSRKDHFAMNGSVQCRSFPCSRIWVQYAVSVDNRLAVGQAQLYSNYSDLQTYPGCSYSACDGATYDDNSASIIAALDGWSSRVGLGSAFNCYTDHNNPSVLLDVSYTWAQAFCSVFWPAMVGSFCLLTLTVHMLYVNVTSWRLNSKTSRDRAAEVDDDTEPPIHRNRNAASLGTRAHHDACYDNAGFYGMHPTGLTIYEENSAVTLDPPSYWQLALSGQFYENGAMMARRPSTDPPTYRQAADDKAIDDCADNDITQNSEL